jgi:hypothetical protein
MAGNLELLKEHLMDSVRIFILALIMVIAGTSSVVAEDDPNALFNQALDLAQDGKTEEAIGLWLEVLDKVEAQFRPSVHRTLGLGFGKLGRMPEAAHHLRKHLETRLQAQSKKTRDKLAAIEEKLATTHFQMTIACDPADATIYLNEEGTAAGYGCPLKWWFPKGRHAIRVARVGYRHTVTHVVVQEGRETRLHAVSLEAVEPDSNEQRVAHKELLQELQRAVGAGQDSVVRAISLEHGSLLKELPCEYGWDAAARIITPTDCNRRVFATLMEAGAKRCPTPGQFRNAIEYGCPEVAGHMLPILEESQILRAIKDLSFTSRYNPTVAHGKKFLTGVQMTREAITELCHKAEEGSAPCGAMEQLDYHLAKWYAAISVRVPEETLLEILALRPELSLRHHCAIVDALIGGMNFNNAADRVKTLARFHPTDGPTCDYRKVLSRAVVYRSFEVIELLRGTAAIEDIAHATREYNADGRWLPRLALNDGRPPAKETLAFGRKLHRLNSDLCKQNGPDSPACASARYVEEQMGHIKAAHKVVTDPAVILKEICAYQVSLDERMEELATIRRVSELSGVQNRGESVQLAQYIVTYEASIKEFSKLYKKASRKTFTPKLCK